MDPGPADAQPRSAVRLQEFQRACRHAACRTFLPERTYAAVEDVPNWKDLGPRLGAAYDLFGDGRTAVKFAWSRYVGGGNYTGEANFLNPQTAASNSANRAWDDLNGNFTPECDFLLPAPNGECRVLQNLNFGVLGELPRSYDPDAVAGWHVRPYNTEMAVTAQHQLTSRIGIDAGYYRRSYGNFHVDDNTLVGPQDFDSYCLTTPVDPRLPGGGGQQLCGFGDIKPAKLGPEFTNRTLADKFGKYEDVYDGVDFSVNTRLGAGTVLRGGFSTGRERIDRCFAVDSPEGTVPGVYLGLGERPAVSRASRDDAASLPDQCAVSNASEDDRVVHAALGNHSRRYAPELPGAANHGDLPGAREPDDAGPALRRRQCQHHKRRGDCCARDRCSGPE